MDPDKRPETPRQGIPRQPAAARAVLRVSVNTDDPAASALRLVLAAQRAGRRAELARFAAELAALLREGEADTPGPGGLASDLAGEGRDLAVAFIRSAREGAESVRGAGAVLTYAGAPGPFRDGFALALLQALLRPDMGRPGGGRG